MVTRRALDVGVDENAVELGGGRWSGRRGGAYEVNKRQEGVGGGWVPGRSMGHMAAWATWQQRAGEGPSRWLRAAQDRHRPKSSGNGMVCDAGGANAKTGEGEPLTGEPPHYSVGRRGKFELYSKN
jgi:hypothetical protein